LLIVNSFFDCRAEIQGSRGLMRVLEKSLTGTNQLYILILTDNHKDYKVVHKFSDNFAHYYRYYFYNSGLSGVR